METGWTQNVVILEAGLSAEERAWYLRAAQKFQWSKTALRQAIDSAAHLELMLDEDAARMSQKEAANTWNRKNRNSRGGMHLQK